MGCNCKPPVRGDSRENCFHAERNEGCFGHIFWAYKCQFSLCRNNAPHWQNYCTSDYFSCIISRLFELAMSYSDLLQMKSRALSVLTQYLQFDCEAASQCYPHWIAEHQHLILEDFLCWYCQRADVRLREPCCWRWKHAKAIRDRAIDATIDHANSWTVSKKTGDVYSTNKPQIAFNSRIAFCLDMHNEAVKAHGWEGTWPLLVQLILSSATTLALLL